MSLIIGTVVRKYYTITLALANGYFCTNASGCGPKVKRGRPERGESLQHKLLLLNF
jgi:hypothetical protein